MLVPIRAVGLSSTAVDLRKSECDTVHGAEYGGLPFVLAWGPPRPVHACQHLHCGCGIVVALYVAAGLWKSE